MKWKEDSEALPEPFKVVACKILFEDYGPRQDWELHWGYVDKEGNWVHFKKFSRLQWLDESDQPAPEGEQPERVGTASGFIDRAIAMLKEQYQDEWLVAGYNGVVALLGYAKVKIERMDEQRQSLTSEVKQLKEQLEKERICFKGYETAVKAQKTCEPAIMSSAFKFDNGKRMICYTSYANGIKSFECDENWKPHPQPFAEIPFPVDHYKTMTNYHLIIRSQHKPEDFVPEHSTELYDQLFTQSKSTQ